MADTVITRSIPETQSVQVISSDQRAVLTIPSQCLTSTIYTPVQNRLVTHRHSAEKKLIPKRIWEWFTPAGEHHHPHWAREEGPILNVVFTNRSRQILLILPSTHIAICDSYKKGLCWHLIFFLFTCMICIHIFPSVSNQLLVLHCFLFCLI